VAYLRDGGQGSLKKDCSALIKMFTKTETRQKQTSCQTAPNCVEFKKDYCTLTAEHLRWKEKKEQQKRKQT